MEKKQTLVEKMGAEEETGRKNEEENISIGHKNRKSSITDLSTALGIVKSELACINLNT